MDRREFLRAAGLGAFGVAGTALASGVTFARGEESLEPARYYERLSEGKIRCLLCPRKCVVAPGQRGYCRARENVGGDYYTAVYGSACARHIDPIEKKPLFHFLPGTTAYSVAAVGCNMACKFCQNWEISQAEPSDVTGVSLPPERLVQEAQAAGSPTVAFTYTEPIVYFEYVIDSARAGRPTGLKTVMISAGYINKEPLGELIKALDAIKIDLKAYSDDFYRDICATSLEPVLETIVSIKEGGTWLEIVNLVIPTLNDDPHDIDRLCKWVVDNVGQDVPIHFTRFYPTYRLKNLPPTPVSSVEKARQIALDRGVRYAYVGNVPAGHPGESTYCPNCGSVVVKRAGYTILSLGIDQGRCVNCHEPIPGVWS